MAKADHDAALDQRRRGSKADQHHDSSHRGYRSRAVHRNTQLAVIGVAVSGVNMRHLKHKQQRKQRQTQQRSSSKSPWLQAA
jgi:hypothetical protein